MVYNRRKMFYYEVMPARVFRKGEGILTYGAREKLVVGQVVRVPLGRSNCLGVVYRKVGEPSFKTREVLGVVYERALPRWLVQGMRWMAEYYLAELPRAINLILPTVGARTTAKGVVASADGLGV